MGLENLSSPFSDISRNINNSTDVKSDKVENSYDDVFPNKLNNPQINIDSAVDGLPVEGIDKSINQGIYTGTYSSNFTSLNQILQTDGTYKPLSEIPTKAQKDEAPLSKILVSSEKDQTLFTYSGHENKKGVEAQTRGGVVHFDGLDSDVRKRYINGALIGKDNKLGFGDFTLNKIYDPTHGANTPTKGEVFIGQSTKNLDVRESGTSFRGGALGKFKEPYIMKAIPDESTNPVLFNRDLLPIGAAVEDLARVLAYQTSPSGLLNLLKENVTNQLIGSAPSNNPAPILFGVKAGGDLNAINKILLPAVPNPLQGNTGFLNFTNKFRDLPGPLGSLRKPFVFEYSKRTATALPFNHLGDAPFDFFGKRYYDIDMPTFKSPKFLGLGSGKKHTSKDKISQLGVEESLFNNYDFWGDYDIDDTYVPKESFAVEKGDFYVKIRDLRDGKYIYFRGYVTGITENVNPTFNPTQYIGKSEDVYVYQKGERDLSFNLKVYPANAEEFDVMYTKINRLTSLAYPEYLPEENDSSLVRMKAPFTELYMGHIGTRDKGQFGFIKSLTYTVPDGGDWDALTATPRMFDIAIGYQILSKRPPSLTTKFYSGVYGANR